MPGNFGLTLYGFKMHKKKKGKSNKKSWVNKQITTTQDNSAPVQAKELQQRIDEFNASFNDYNGIMISFYNKNRFAKTTQADVEQFANSLKRLNQALTILGKFAEKIDRNSFAHGPVTILQIKFLILLGQFYIRFDETKSIEYASSGILAWAVNVGDLKYHHDFEFQEFISHTLSSLDHHHRNKKYDLDHLNLLPIFAKSCPDNIFKLVSLFKYYVPDELNYTANIDHMRPSDKQDFEQIYNTLIVPLQQSRENKTLDFRSTKIYLEANLIIYKFKAFTHQSSLWYWRNFKDDLEILNYKKISKDEFRNSFDIFCEWTQQYLKPSTDMFLELDWAKLKQNAKWLVEIKDLFLKWPEQIMCNLNLFAKWVDNYDALFDVKDLWNSILDEMQKLVACYINIKISFDRYLKLYPLNPLDINLDKYSNGIEFIKKFIHTHEIVIFASDIGTAILEHNTKVLSKSFEASLDAETAELQRKRTEHQEKKAAAAKTNQNNNNQENVSLEEKPEKQIFVKPVANSELQLINADKWISQKRSDMAIRSYQLALALAEEEGDLHQQLKAIDGLGSSYALLLSPKLNDLHTLLQNRLKKVTPLNSTARNNLVQTIKELVLDYDIVLANFEKFKTLSKQDDILKIKDIEFGIEYMNNSIVTYLMQFQYTITDIKWLCYTLIEACKLERVRFIMALGAEVKPDGTDLEKYQAGEIEFANLGKKNGHNAPQRSNYTLDLKAFADSAALLNTFRMTIITPAIQVHLPWNIVETFAHLNKVSNGHILVGSTVINLVLQHWNQPLIPTQDIDFISANFNTDELRMKGYHHSEYINNLYSSYFLNEKIELICLENDDNWLMQSLLTRPFTITALSCDSNGYILDPTHQGLQDLYDRCIRIIGDPIIRLNNDPIIALLIIKFLRLGFKLDKDLQEVLYTWEPAQLDNKAHFYVVARGHLHRFDMDYVKDLIEFGLIKKLFDIEHKGDLGRTINLLKQTISHKQPDSLTDNRYGMFHHRTNDSAEAGILQVDYKMY